MGPMPGLEVQFLPNRLTLKQTVSSVESSDQIYRMLISFNGLYSLVVLCILFLRAIRVLYYRSTTVECGELFQVINLKKNYFTDRAHVSDR